MGGVRRQIMRAGSRHVGALVAVAAIALAALLPSALRADTIPDPPGYTVTALSPTTNLVDGQVLSINVKSVATKSVDRVEIRECRPDVTYSAPADMLPNTGKCPLQPLSSNADDSIVRFSAAGFDVLARSAAGGTIQFRVGSGVVPLNDPTFPTLTCDPTHACWLVVQLVVSGVTTYWTTPLTFVDDDPLRACGKLSSGIINTQGSDELQDAWSGWTRDFCATTGAGAPTRMAFGGEDNAVSAFATSSVDIAYTSVGYDDTVGMTTIPADRRRAMVAVPVALNAAVIAAGGGVNQLINGSPTGDKAPFPAGSLSLTSDEVAALLGGGTAYVGRLDLPFITNILGRNPALHGRLFSPEALVMGPSLALSSVWYATDYLATVSPQAFVAPQQTPPLHTASRSLATAQPPYDQARLTQFTGRPSLQKVMFPASLSQFQGPIWTLSDLATSASIGITPVAIQTANQGPFVGPTRDAMVAAVALMKPNAYGMLEPDPTAMSAADVTAADATAPYPLTYVEYAMVPAEPLVDSDTCQVRSDSQAALVSWLNYVTGPGQQKLPGGLQALPQSLLDQAKTAIAAMGQSPVTGACAGRVTTASSSSGSSSPNVASAPPSGGFTSSIPSFPSSGLLGSTGLTSTATAGSTTPGATKPTETAVAIPAFAGRALPDVTDPAFALFAIVLITSLAVFITSQSLFGASSTAGAGAAAGGGSTGFGFSAPKWGPVPLVALWAAVAVTGIGLVMYGIGPMLAQRDQQDLLRAFRTEVSHATHANEGLQGARARAKAGDTVTPPPEIGSPVAALEIGALQVQAVAVEGIGPSQTSKGPGHVPGTAGIGQPGNSVVVARRNAYGGTFKDIGKLRKGDVIVTTTTQGQTVYRVQTVSTAASTDGLYKSTKQDQLTIVTSGNREPWNSSEATVVVAKMEGLPYPPTTQGALTSEQTSVQQGSSVIPSVVLALFGYAAAIALAVLVYRRFRFRVAYLITIAPLVALTIITGETLGRLLPSWI
jgi:sortase A